MADQYVIAVEGLESFNALDKMGSKIATVARQTINSATRRTRTSSAKEIRRQVNFPASYLSDSSKRLSITKFATEGDLEAKITGRSRPTSLARFIHGQGRGSGGAAVAQGVNVEVKPGHARRLKRAFVVKLRAGTGEGPNSNLGLAIRLQGGKKPSRAYKPVPLSKGLWLLYGPSVDQVFKAVREQVKPGAEDFMAREFTRLMDLEL
ncbi:MAG: hypothetical protein DI537_19165 [Stutzerimonas stutzeri]|nr:MAG: hypothetical protein DI537_19165 [Stutzerimonas stutzeri]